MKHGRTVRLCTAGRIFALLFCLAALAACVSTPDSSVGSNAPRAAARDYLALAMGYFDAGDLDAARHHLENARLNDAGQAEIDHIAALLAAAEGDYELAERHFRRVLEVGLGLERGDAAPRNNYGVMLYSLGRDEEALAQFRAAAADQTYRGRAHALENLGRVLLRRRSYDEAREAFAGALDLNGELPLAALELSLLHRRNGNPDEAVRLFREYLRIAENQRLTHGPKALLAGAEFAWQSGNRSRVEEFGSILGKLYPETMEYRVFMELINGERC